MKALRLRAPFPLLRKDLAEQAARRRTYVLRVAYAVLLAGAFALVYHSAARARGGNALYMLGCGDDLLAALVGLQFVGIYVFLPGMMAGALAGEKERDSIGLLLVTDLRPWEIVLEKLLGRLVPMFGFLLLSLPLLAIAYAFGGITTDTLLGSAFALTLACLQVGAFALMLSAFCRTTAQAFVGCYVLGILFYFALPIVYVLINEFMGLRVRWDDDVLFALFPPYLFFERVLWDRLSTALLAGIPIILSTGLFLILARVFVVRRAFLRSRGMILAAFHRLDAFWHRANRLVGGIVLVKDRDTLPGDRPVLWREVNRHTLGRTSHLIRVACILGIPVALVAVAAITLDEGGRDANLLTAMIALLWVIAALALSIPSATAIASERVNRTLDVLLATPLTGAEIVLQKAWGRRRLGFVLSALIMLVVLLEAMIELRPLFSVYLAASLLSVVVYPPMVTWVATYIGLKARTPTRAIVVTMVVLVLWCAGPPIALGMIDVLTWLRAGRLPLSLGFLLSPASLIGFAESGHEWDFFGPMVGPALVVNFVWHGGIWLFFRTHCLVHAEELLGRAASPARAASQEG
ncbi:MAG: ABC transporter permease subunit [Candidatus Brocadiaceae bacterium]|nr:ABC transporter permease subunit [Candidatus Brocadiaceae bacterium]